MLVFQVINNNSRWKYDNFSGLTVSDESSSTLCISNHVHVGNWSFNTSPTARD